MGCCLMFIISTPRLTIQKIQKQSWFIHGKKMTSVWKRLISTTRKRSLGQGYVFTPVCNSVHGGGVSQHAMVRRCLPLVQGMSASRSRGPPGQTLLPWADSLPLRWPLKRAVRILLECILVVWYLKANETGTVTNAHPGRLSCSQSTFLLIYKVDNIWIFVLLTLRRAWEWTEKVFCQVFKGLKAKIFQSKDCLHWKLKQGLLIFYFDAFLTELNL